MRKGGEETDDNRNYLSCVAIAASFSGDDERGSFVCFGR
jgi:hypothetical protein